MHVAAPEHPQARNGANNAMQKDDFPVHAWYRFVLSFPPHLVRQYISAFKLGSDDLLLDPFCGTGTTLVEAKKNRIPSVGCDAHPFAALVSRVKTNWTLDGRILRNALRRILRRAAAESLEHGLHSLSFDALMLQDEGCVARDRFQLTEEEERLLPTGFLSQRPLQRLLILRGEIDRQTAEGSPEIHEFFLLALAHVIANGAGNFAFGPEMYRTKPKPDYDVLGHFARHADLMITTLIKTQSSGLAETPSTIFTDDARLLVEIPKGISAVITSPPYPNEKDYTRTTRVESILLRIVTDKASLREVKESLLRSNTRNVFVDDTDGAEVREFDSIQNVCQAIEKRRIELEKDSGFTSGRHALPVSINNLGTWMIVGWGKAQYAFVRLATSPEIKIQNDLLTILLPNATPEIVSEYAGTDEQGLLAKVHYNRLLDIFLQITCYHLQNHWRTSVKNKGQCEIDDLYVGLNINGKQFVVPVEAKCASESLSKTQIVQMIDFSRERYPKLIIRPVGVQEMKDGSLVLIEFTPAVHPDEIKIKEMRRYKLVPFADVPLDKQQAQA